MCSSYIWKFPCGHSHTEKQYCRCSRRKTVIVRQEGSDQERGRSETPRSSSSSTPSSPQVQPSQPSTPPPLSPSNSDSFSSPATPEPHQRSSRSRSPSSSKPDHRDRSPLRPHRGLWPKPAAEPSPPPQPATPTPKKEAMRTPLPEPKPKISTKVRRHHKGIPCADALYLVNDDPTNVCFLPGCRFEELGRLWACCRCERGGREVVGNRGERCRGTKGNREIRCEHRVCEGCWGFGEFFLLLFFCFALEGEELLTWD